MTDQDKVGAQFPDAEIQRPSQFTWTHWKWYVVRTSLPMHVPSVIGHGMTPEEAWANAESRLPEPPAAAEPGAAEEVYEVEQPVKSARFHRSAQPGAQDAKGEETSKFAPRYVDNRPGLSNFVGVSRKELAVLDAAHAQIAELQQANAAKDAEITKLVAERDGARLAFTSAANSGVAWQNRAESAEAQLGKAVKEANKMYIMSTHNQIMAQMDKVLAALTPALEAEQ